VLSESQPKVCTRTWGNLIALGATLCSKDSSNCQTLFELEKAKIMLDDLGKQRAWLKDTADEFVL
jgi:hypothetical protein